MGNYYEMVIYAPMTDISDLSWEVKVNRKTFNCNMFRALDELKQLCPNIKSCTIEKFTGFEEILHCVQNDRVSTQSVAVLLLADERADVLNKHAHGNRVKTTLRDNHIGMLL